MASLYLPLGVLFVISALLAGVAGAAQAGLPHINRVRLRQLLEQGKPRAGAFAIVLEQPSGMFTTIAVLETLSISVAGLSAIGLALALWQFSPALAGVVLFLLFLVLLLVQVTARAIAMNQPDATAARLVGPLVLLGRVCWPLIAPFLALERLVLGALGFDQSADAPATAEEDLRMLVEEENGVLQADEREMIQSIFEMNDRPVRELMVPRIDIQALPQTATVSDAVDLALRSGYSRIPVFEGDLDNIVGVLVVKDLLRQLKAGNPQAPVAELLRPPYFVPETKKIDELLREMQDRRMHLAVVVDEYGGTAGLITLEDLVEEIVGEIHDEFDTNEEELYERISPTEVIFDARASIHDVNDIMELHLDDEEFDTLGGLVYDRLGKVPVVSDEVRVNGCTVTVLTTAGRRIKKVRIRVGTPSQAIEPVG